MQAGTHYGTSRRNKGRAVKDQREEGFEWREQREGGREGKSFGGREGGRGATEVEARWGARYWVSLATLSNKKAK